MYAGRLVERAPAGSLFRAPRHPYTYGLLNSFPPMHGERREMIGIPGSPPDLSAVPPGCAFHPRCPHAMTRCEHEVPLLAEPYDDRLSQLAQSAGGERRAVACWLHDGTVTVPSELARPSSAAAREPQPAAPQAPVPQVPAHGAAGDAIGQDRGSST
jgi:peptide/nickel transport system ATP-binding protein